MAIVAQHEKDIEYIKTFNNMRFPCDLTFNNEKGKHIKVPAMARWAGYNTRGSGF